jgi:hypothetical protein
VMPALSYFSEFFFKHSWPIFCIDPIPNINQLKKIIKSLGPKVATVHKNYNVPLILVDCDVTFLSW